MAKEKVQIPGRHLQGLWGIKCLVAKYAAFLKPGPWKLEGGGVFLIDLLPFNWPEARSRSARKGQQRIAFPGAKR